MAKADDDRNLYQRGTTWWLRAEIDGLEVRESLRTTCKKVARKRRNNRLNELRAQAAENGGLRKLLIEAMVEFSDGLEARKFGWGDETQRRYLVSMRAVSRTLIEIAADNDFDLTGLHVDEVTTALISDIVGNRLEKVEVSTVNRDLTALSHLFIFCKNHQWTSENPVVASYEKQGMKEALPPIVLPTDKAVEKVVARSPLTFGCLVRFIDREGTRARETALLQWPDIEFHPADPTKATATLRHTKGGVPRVIELQPETVAMLNSMPRSNRSPYVFFNTGEEGWYKDVSTRFWQYGQDVEFGARLHDLRHRFAIRMLKGGWSIYRVSAHLGHRSVLTTERYYFRELTQEQQLRARRSGNNGFN